MTESALVSIITPTFNSAEFLSRTLRCVAEQSYPNIEHIVVDGGSTDGTLEILKNQQRVRWVSEPDNGMYDAINKGLKMAEGSILAYLNSDDLYFTDTVERVVKFFSSHPETELVYSDCRYIDEKEEEMFVRKYPSFNWTLYAVLMGSTIPQQSCFWRRSVHEKVGYFDVQFQLAGDFEFFIRAGKESRFTKIPGKPLAQFRFHRTMQTINYVQANEEEVQQIHRIHGFPPGVRSSILMLIAKARYKSKNVHRIWDKMSNLLSGDRTRYRA